MEFSLYQISPLMNPFIVDVSAWGVFFLIVLWFWMEEFRSHCDLSNTCDIKYCWCVCLGESISKVLRLFARPCNCSHVSDGVLVGSHCEYHPTSTLSSPFSFSNSLTLSHTLYRGAHFVSCCSSLWVNVVVFSQRCVNSTSNGCRWFVVLRGVDVGSGKGSFVERNCWLVVVVVLSDWVELNWVVLTENQSLSFYISCGWCSFDRSASLLSPSPLILFQTLRWWSILIWFTLLRSLALFYLIY